MQYKQKLFISIIPIIFFILAGFLVIITDTNVFYFYKINTISNFTGFLLWEHITILGDGFFAALILVLFLRTKKIFLCILFSLLLTAIFTHTLKPIFNELRPAGILDIDSFFHIGPLHKKKSFPSGHTMTAFALIVSIILYSKNKINLLLLFLSLSAGFSRIVLGVHWPIDILFGAAFGCVSAVIGFYLSDLIYSKHELFYLRVFVGIFVTISALIFSFYYDSGYKTQIFQIISGVIIFLIGAYNIYITIKNRENKTVLKNSEV